MAKILLEMKNITKTFPGVKALDNVNAQYMRFISAFDQSTSESLDDYQAIFNDEIKQIVPSVVFIFLQVYFNKTLFCGLLSNIILRDETLSSLKKSAKNLEQSVTVGLYAKVDRLTDKDEVVKVLAPLALLSKKGMKQYGK